jgi:PLP dependent protein
MVENFLKIRDQLKKDVTIVGVAKKQPIERVTELVDAGLRVLANNYVQDGKVLMAKFPSLEWHFIGHIQSRKAKELVNYHLVESLDRIEIARILNGQLGTRKLPVLVEINIGGEAQKSGIPPETLPDFLTSLQTFPNLVVKGLMCMPPPLNPPANRRAFFKNMKSLYDEHASRESFEYLSMGTSDDYRIAVEEGSNMVRLGTALFGERRAE